MRRGSPIRKGIVRTFVAGIVIAVATVGYGQSIRWAVVKWKVRHDFPGVRRIEPKSLADWLDDKHRVPPVLLDVRTKAEYDISHIHGACRVDPTAAANSINLAKDDPIVTYCSVGYRSGRCAKKLRDAGYINVQNMAGSIFQWANEGRPLEHDGQKAYLVHPYNSSWGKLLKPELRANISPAGSGM